MKFKLWAGPLRLPLLGVVAAAVALVAIMGWSAQSSEAGPGSGSTAIVSLGDSFISGEAGRWNGNSLNTFGTRGRHGPRGELLVGVLLLRRDAGLRVVVQHRLFR